LTLIRKIINKFNGLKIKEPARTGKNQTDAAEQKAHHFQTKSLRNQTTQI
jgi:hypothetical protein